MKNKITEAQITRAINESIEEVLNEAAENEGLGRFLGNALGKGISKARGFVQDFKNAYRDGVNQYPEQQVSQPEMQPRAQYQQPIQQTTPQQVSTAPGNGQNFPVGGQEYQPVPQQNQQNTVGARIRSLQQRVIQDKQTLLQAGFKIAGVGKGYQLYDRNGQPIQPNPSQAKILADYKAAMYELQQWKIQNANKYKVNGKWQMDRQLSEARLREIVSEAINNILNL